MENLFLTIFLLSPVLLIVLLKEPHLLSTINVKEPSKFKALVVSFGLLAFSLVGLALSSDSASTEQPKTHEAELDETQTSKINGTKVISTDEQLEDNLILVTRIIDGDTIEIETGEKVRLIGIDTPETVHPSKPVECMGKEASARTKELIENKKVRLEKDVSETDKYGRLLRYIWLDGELINEKLVREGFANSSSYPPDIKYQERFNKAERYAVENNLGLWGELCSTPSPTAQPIIYNPTPAPYNPPSSNYLCDCSKTCSQISSCEEAYYLLNICGCSKRDGDDDGIPCENLCQ